MAGESRVFRALAGVDFSNISRQELIDIFLGILNQGIHGISFSAYAEGQGPGSVISEDQVRARLSILRPYIKWVRSFSCTEGNEHIPRIAREVGIKTLVGAWLGDDERKNNNEINGIINLASAGYVDIAAVGNEVLLRGDLTEDQIIDAIMRVKKAVPNIPVGYVDAYFEFEDHPRIADACDIILANCYPFWEGVPIEHSLVYLKEMYHRAARTGRGKKVIVTETGWPNTGTPERNAVPSIENALMYFINTFKWSAADDVELFYFASFDEAWKIAAEGDVGAAWGLWDKDGNLKYR